MGRRFRPTVVGEFTTEGGSGTEVPPVDPGPNDVVHTHPNIETLKKLTTSQEGNLLFKNNSIWTTPPNGEEW